jgi:hypothetical protein
VISFSVTILYLCATTMIQLVLHMTAAGISRAFVWLSTQSTPRILLIVQAFLLVAYLILVLLAVCVLPSTFSEVLAIRVPVARERLWDHLLDVQKNPLSAQQRVKTTRVISSSSSDPEEWHEEIGSQEILVCKTVERHRPSKLVRECWAEAVYLQGNFVFLLEPKKDGEDDASTILRIFITVEAQWGSFFTPIARLILHYKPQLIQQAATEYCKGLCRDMGVSYGTVEAWE